ncbi:mediator of RNA polymerase II transcription subunit 10 [Mytilinidion resinicola]|uniref:Mediator of RNA polymerase II transcription subunit 10 n=1 Tax=Mytilinidion resinicola TaxID=574789 RepID=A0A6A6Z933_9PEZI|nr:mediator of RNA polymerase II transcription subunit 10 [Mytilinidion resinicola]KAF2816795.1 mediator of RNA polymerase II transcription subunit 10 [Mytilinidion resinicola]
MAPPSLDDVDAQLKAIVQNLYSLTVTAYQHEGAPSVNAMKEEIMSLLRNLNDLKSTAPRINVEIPPEVISYVEHARNPDIYTREMMELLQRSNQLLKGKSEAFAQLRDILAKEIMTGIPELRGDVKKVVESTGGTVAD